jgi:hypothetical protein
MRPFLISDKCRKLRDVYPHSAVLSEAIKGVAHLELRAILRLWFSEGIPFAFQTNPMLYEVVREWMAMRLQVNPKSVTMIGSGRIGYSVCPLPKFGREFSAESDLDFSIIDHKLFSDLVQTFFEWESDVDSGRVSPRNNRQRGFWDDSLKKLPENIARGFIDPYKVPTLYKYQRIVTIQDTLYLLGERLKVTPGAPKVKQVSVRVYKDWNSFFRQMCLNFSLTVASFLPTRLVTHGTASHLVLTEERTRAQ